MGVGADLYVYDVVVKKFTFAISSPDEFLSGTVVASMGHRGTCSLDFQQFNFFQFTLELDNLRATLCGCASSNTFVHCIISRQTISM